ncbi:MAG: DUF4349 domain-containing protein [Oscillospiraceae bacterium]|nr:DUF4349 domain-containing protein [Oscillospiraceae bacterium]
MKSIVPSQTRRFVPRIIAALVALFLLLFAGRFAWNLLGPEPPTDYGYDFDRPQLSSVSNQIATNVTAAANNGGAGNGLEQKYEKVATLSSTSTQYEADLEAARAALQANGALTLEERSGGLPDTRAFTISVGVRPEKFDELTAALTGIGKLQSIDVTSTDRTGAYQQLLAEKENLERRLERYEALKGHSVSMGDYLSLQNELIKIEEELQEKLVALGEYSDKVGLNTVHYALTETVARSRGIGAALSEALLWSALSFAATMGILLLAALLTLVTTAVLLQTRKLKSRNQD